MYFYLFHQINHGISPLESTESEGHGARNVRTLLFGGLAYIFTAAFLFSQNYQQLISSVFVLMALRDWFMWFLLLDIFAMAIVYKRYWGGTILKEFKDVWKSNEEKKASALSESKLENDEQT